MKAKRAEDRKFHFTFEVELKKSARKFYGLHSTDDLEDGFDGAGQDLSISKKRHGANAHSFKILQVFDSRKEAKDNLEQLKLSLPPKLPRAKTFSAYTEAEDRKLHFTYKVTCTNTAKVFYGVHSADEMPANYLGAGQALSISKREHGKENHVFELLELFPTRSEAKVAYNKLKESELTAPKRVDEYTFHYVYLTVRFDGKYYIGAHSTNNLNDGYKGSGGYISRSLRKHGHAKHTCEILEMCTSRDHAFDREEAIITPEMLADPLCMNLEPGGNRTREVYGFTEDSRAKLSVASKAAVRTPEWCAKIGEAHKGKVTSDKRKAEISLQMKGRVWSQDIIDKRTAGQLSSDKFKKRYRPIVIDGITYQNGREAVAALNVPGSTMHYRLISPSTAWANWYYADQTK